MAKRRNLMWMTMIPWCIPHPYSICKDREGYVGECSNITVQALQTQDGSLPQGLTIQNTYTKLRKGSKRAVMVVWNNTAYPKTLQKKTPVARVVVASSVPEPSKGEKLEEKAGRFHGSPAPELRVRQRHGKLLDKLDLSSLESWTPELADVVHQLLVEYHDMFSLDPAKLGCTHSTEHIIKVTDDTPFTEWFRQIPPLMLRRLGITWRKCWNLVPLDLARVPGIMPWSWYGKRQRLAFLYQFLPPKHLHKRIQEVLECLVGAGHFSCLDLKSRFWQIKVEEMSKQYTAFTLGNLGFFKCNWMPFGLYNAPATFQWLMQNCMGELNLIYCLIYLDELIVILQMAEEHLHRLHVIFNWLWEYNLKLKPSKCSLFKEEINYLGPLSIQRRHLASQCKPKGYHWVCPHHKLTPRLQPSLALWVTIGGSWKALHKLPNCWLNTWPGREPAGRWNGFCYLKLL